MNRAEAVLFLRRFFARGIQLCAFSISVVGFDAGCHGSTEPKIGPPASVSILSGDKQSGVAGSQLPQPVTVQVRDQGGSGVPGTSIKIIATIGNGTFVPDSTVTDAEGKASFVWTLGKSDVPQVATVTTGTLSAQANATVTTAFSVDVRFFGTDPTDQAFSAFVNAAARVRGLVIGDVEDFNIPSELGADGLDLAGCGISGVVLHEVVDDLIIYATVKSIDGPGRTLASGGPCYVREITGPACGSVAQCYGPTIVGRMTFDADDIAGLVSSNRLLPTVLHEMLHVVGFGTLWDDKSYFTGAGTSDPRFLGPRAISGCNDAGGAALCASGVPVENVGGPGSADGHWRESIFDTELMTSISEGGTVAMPLSKMTIQSIGDIGYSVNVLAADPYTIPVGSALRADVAGLEEGFDIVMRPQFVVTRTGSIRRINKTQ
jgi:hypothetical protein